MKRHLSHISIPFPMGLMSTSRNATHMPHVFSREVRNMLTNLSGAGTKRNGFSFVGKLPEKEKIIKIAPFMSIKESQLLAFCDSGAVYLSVDEGSSWKKIDFCFTPSSHIRWVHFARKLVLCNGVDDLCSWNGKKIEPIFQWIKEKSEILSRVSDTEIDIEKGNASDYKIGQRLKCCLDDDVTHILTVSHLTKKSDNNFTLTVKEGLVTSDISTLYREEKPPKFNFIYAAHDRLWGIGNQDIQAEQKTGSPERSFVFYTHDVRDENAWRDDLGALKYIDLSGKMPVLDEVLSMAVKDQFTLFFMRNHIQIWSGYSPTKTGDMSWQKTISLGLPHGDLVMSLPNDIAFFTPYGVRTLTRMLQTEQLDVSDVGSEIDPTLSKALSQIQNSPEKYKHSVHTFLNAKQGWYGFYVGDTSFIFQTGAQASGWSIFDGYFSKLTAVCTRLNGDVFIAIKDKVYRYDDKVYADEDAPILTKWWTPWLNVDREGRWANKYSEIVAEQGVPISILLTRFKNYNSASYITSSIQIKKQPDHWDEAFFDEGFFDYVASDPTTVRDSYVADTFSYSVESESTEGPLTIYGLKLYGIREK